MKKIVAENPVYFYAVLSLIFFAGGYWRADWTQMDAIEVFSRHRSDFGNTFFPLVTQLGEVWAFAFFTVLFAVLRNKVAILIPLAGLTVMGLMYWLKDILAHPRPILVIKAMHLESQISLVPNVELLNGLNSYPSGHTTAAFALFTLVALAYPRWWAQLLAFCTALTVGISRIYLVQHFPEDVFLGALIGVTVAMIFYYLRPYIYPVIQRKEE